MENRQLTISSVKFYFFSLSLILLALTAQTFGQTAQTQNNVTTFDVNGLKVLVKQRVNSPTVSVGLFVRGGAQNLTKENAGIEDFTLDVATEGSQKYPRALLRQELAKTGSNVGASSSYDYSLIALSTTRANFDRSWDVFTDLVINPSFNAQDVDRVRDRNLTALRESTSDADSYLEILGRQGAYKNTSYENNPNGTIENITRFKAADLRAYQKSILQTSRLLLVVVGDLDAETLKNRIAATFGKLPRGDYKAKPLTAISFAAPTVEVTQRDLPTNYIQGVFSAPSPANADYYAMQVATAILRDRVFEEVRVKRNLSYAPNAFLNSTGENLGGIYVTAVDANQAVSVMLNEINTLQTAKVDADDIEGVVGQYLTTFYLGQETNAAQVLELAQYELIGGGWQNSQTYLDKVRAVTPDDIRRVAQKYMRNIRFVVLGKPTDVDKSIFTKQNPTSMTF
ncbi:MAG: insulinase family protein [Pyrinomonadaceae bacterium]|nr:insulinase family protein [Pyrinomonadaceae bacterium]